MELKKKIHALHIKWEGPMNPEEAKKKESKEDYGVYQIYGFHPVYGPCVLLYIGKADDQNFGSRFKQHGNSWMKGSMGPEEYKVYLGRLAGKSTPGDDDWSEEIDIAERLLIFAHSPAYNSQNIQSVDEKKVHNYMVFNWANPGSLLNEVSGMRMTDLFWEDEDIDFEKLNTYKWDK